MKKTFWHVKHCSLFQRLDPEQLTRLEQVSRVRSFAKGKSVYLPSDQAESVFLLAEGRIRLCSTTPQGKQVILAYVETGELFGELTLFNGGEHEERAEAALNSTVVLIPGETVRKLMDDAPQFTLGITKLIGFRRARIEKRLRGILFRSNRDRLVQLIVELAEQYGKKHPLGVAIGISLSHQELASIIGATRESVTLILGELQLEGILNVSRQKLLIKNLSRLAAMAEVPCPSIHDQSRSHRLAELFRSGGEVLP